MDICVVKGILTPAETMPAPKPAVTILNNKKANINAPHPSINWQTILRDATFHSLIKHTGFTPSLDEKIETDRLLWEKIQSARFLRKQGKIDDFDKVKTGVLVDTTRERGYLEFRQSDRSVYNCEQSRCKSIYDRLLALWRIQKFEPNSIWIRVKIPRYPTSEDVYEYTPSQGLKQINANPFLNDNTQTRWNSASDLSIVNFEKLENNEKFPISRLDSEYYHRNDEIRNIYKKQATRIHKELPYTLVSGTRQSYLPYIVGVQLDSLPTQEVKNPAWTQQANYFPRIEPITVISEFRKNEKVYDGFIPSVGPTGRPPLAVYRQTIPKPVVFRHYPTYVSTRVENTGIYFTSTTPKSFKPSTEFVRYSEPDPFYVDNSYAFTTPRTNDITDVNYESTNPNKSEQYPTSINSQLLIYDDKNINDTLVNIPVNVDNVKSDLTKTEPTANTINILHVTEDEEQILLPTSDTAYIRTTPVTALTTTNRVQIKHTQRSTTAINSETYGYAPLFIKWGEKIKPTISNKNPENINGQNKKSESEDNEKHEVVTSTLPGEVETMKNEFSEDVKEDVKPFTDNQTIPPEILNNSTADQTINFTNFNIQETVVNENSATNSSSKQLNGTTETDPSTITTETSNETVSLDDWLQSTSGIFDPKLLPKSDKSSFTTDTGTTNLVIDVEDKSPEEVVNELTTIGVKNTTRIEGYPTNEYEVGSYNTLRESEEPNTDENSTTYIPDQQTEDSDPISIVVNRISKSYSYKTAKGKIRDLKQLAKSR